MRLAPAFGICVALTGCSNAQTPVEVADGRQIVDAADVSAWAARPEVRAATAAARAHWSGQDAAYEEDVRVMAVADGAFTEAGADQQAVLFLMSPWPRGNPKVGLAVVEGGRLVRNLAFEGLAQALTAVPDLDGDGRDELALTGEFGMGGEVARALTLGGFGDDGFVERGGTALFDSDCATGRGGGASRARRLVALAGPVFRAERFTQACESDAWEPEGVDGPLALDPPSGTAYVDLPVR